MNAKESMQKKVEEFEEKPKLLSSVNITAYTDRISPEFWAKEPTPIA